ncbi:hypothetical protein SAMN05216535_1439 [Stutzerimonas xanthomarina]|uniref:Uncharacterized protein n=2 Tax=Stutzerimonas xanthomarina TaxID=271420 RepID=A0A1M5PS78_9GAMM|nr:hypothetical protein SAMN05216535_1439 [Stutzerimonas xanthomarina]SHH04695.1 hypothetical protein SAMN02744645_2374 [Stutzerimonas xanthomarina DSM 18231]
MRRFASISLLSQSAVDDLPTYVRQACQQAVLRRDRDALSGHRHLQIFSQRVEIAARQLPNPYGSLHTVAAVDAGATRLDAELLDQFGVQPLDIDVLKMLGGATPSNKQNSTG